MWSPDAAVCPVLPTSLTGLCACASAGAAGSRASASRHAAAAAPRRGRQSARERVEGEAAPAGRRRPAVSAWAESVEERVRRFRPASSVRPEPRTHLGSRLSALGSRLSAQKVRVHGSSFFVKSHLSTLMLWAGWISVGPVFLLCRHSIHAPAVPNRPGDTRHPHASATDGGQAGSAHGPSYRSAALSRARPGWSQHSSARVRTTTNTHPPPSQRLCPMYDGPKPI